MTAALGVMMPATESGNESESESDDESGDHSGNDSEGGKQEQNKAD